MNEYYEKEIERLHSKLATIYLRGLLTATEKIEVKGLWARIESLQKTMVKIQVKESQYGTGS